MNHTISSVFVKEATLQTPYLQLTNENLVIKGRSIPENSKDIYGPLISHLKPLLDTISTDFKVTISLEYFNTSSSSHLLDIFHLLEKAACTSTIYWEYLKDDEDMLEVGQDYDVVIRDVKFVLVPV